MSDDEQQETPQATETPNLPKVEDLRRDIEARLQQTKADWQKTYVRGFSRLSVDAQEKYEHLQGLKDHYRHKGKWSYFLMAVMGGMVVFQSYLLAKVGMGEWDFSKYEWLLPALLVQNLAQVIGLAVFVVKALFKDMKT